MSLAHSSCIRWCSAQINPFIFQLGDELVGLWIESKGTLNQCRQWVAVFWASPVSYLFMVIYAWFITHALPTDNSIIIHSVFCCRFLWDQWMGECRNPWAPLCQRYNHSHTMIHQQGNTRYMTVKQLHPCWWFIWEANTVQVSPVTGITLTFSSDLVFISIWGRLFSRFPPK